MIGKAFSAQEQALSAFEIGYSPLSTHRIIIQRCFLSFFFDFSFLGGESHIPRWCVTVTNLQSNVLYVVQNLFGLIPLLSSSPASFFNSSWANSLQSCNVGVSSPPFWKWPWARLALTVDTAKYQANFRSAHKCVAHVVSIDISSRRQLFWSTTLCLYLNYIPKGCL